MPYNNRQVHFKMQECHTTNSKTYKNNKQFELHSNIVMRTFFMILYKSNTSVDGVNIIIKDSDNIVFLSYLNYILDKNRLF